MKSINNLAEIDLSVKNNILLLGNGVDRCFNGDSWDKIIYSLIDDKENKKDIINRIEDFPENMQVVIATDNNVNEKMESVQKQLDKCISKEQSEFIKQICSIPVNTILTTNYDYSIEQALGCKFGKRNYYKIRKQTKETTKTEKQFHLFQYSDVDNKKIWHIHGDICNKNSMIMGYYYYGKLLYQIQAYIIDFMRSVNTAKRNGTIYQPKSWVDYFLLCDVYILGFGMNLTETDLWWLLECKRRNFPETKVYYYQPKGGININVKTMLDIYENVEIVDNIEANNDYKNYYISAISDINNKIIN